MTLKANQPVCVAQPVAAANDRQTRVLSHLTEILPLKLAPFALCVIAGGLLDSLLQSSAVFSNKWKVMLKISGRLEIFLQLR